MPSRARKCLLTDVGAAVVADCLADLGADAGFVATPSEDGTILEVARVTPFAAKPVRIEVPLDAPYPIATTVRSKEPLFIQSNDDLCHHPGLVRMKSDDHACATLPLFGERDQLLGALNLGFEEPRRFSAEDLRVFALLARHCSRAMAAALAARDEVSRRSRPARLRAVG
jgi:GAF domain-containing protein